MHNFEKPKFFFLFLFSSFFFFTSLVPCGKGESEGRAINRRPTDRACHSALSCARHSLLLSSQKHVTGIAFHHRVFMIRFVIIIVTGGFFACLFFIYLLLWGQIYFHTITSSILYKKKKSIKKRSDIKI